MRIRNLLSSTALLVVGLLSFGAPESRANLIITLDTNVMSGFPGSELIFSGTIIEDDVFGSEIFLNDIAVTFTFPGDSYLSSIQQYFLDTVNGDLIVDGLPGHDRYTGGIFKIAIAPNTPYGTYIGSIDILGGINGPFADFDSLASQTFQVNVVPEPGVYGLTMAGLALVTGVARRRRMR